MTDRRKALPGSGAGSGLRQLIPGRRRRAGPGEQMRTLSIGGRVLRVAARDGNPDWPPLLLCNGIGAALEVLRMLTPRRHHDPAHAARIAGELYGGSVRDDPALARDLLHPPARPGPGPRDPRPYIR